MSVVYNQPTINARLQAVVSQIDGGVGQGWLYLLSNSTVICSIQLATPSGTVNGGVLTFGGTLLDPSAAASGTITTAHITDGSGTLIVSGLTAGVPGSGADVIVSNGLNTTFITAGQTVQVLAAQIVGT